MKKQMDRNEFKRQLDELQREIFLAIVSYQVWLASRLTREVVDILNAYRHFYTPVRNALYVTMLMGFAKVFDRDTRTVSLKNLMKVAKEDVANLVPNMTREGIDKLEQRLAQHDATLEAIKRLRNQHLAHRDAAPEPKLPFSDKDVNQMIGTLEKVFNELSAGHNGSACGWSYQAKLSAWQTSKILQILSEDAQARKARADAATRAAENDQT